jgi:hypothetical protein
MDQFIDNKYQPSVFRSKLPVNPIKTDLDGRPAGEPQYLLLDPKRTVPQRDMIKYRVEREYFDSMTLNDVTQIGPERILAAPAQAGTTAIAMSQDGNYFAIASSNGYLRLYSSRELAIRGVAIHKNAKIQAIRFLPGMLVCMMDNGYVNVYLTEVRKPLSSSFPADFREIVPLYEFNRNMGGLISTEGNFRFNSLD